MIHTITPHHQAQAVCEIVFRQAGRLTIFPTPAKWWLVMAGFHQRISGIEHKKGINENTVTLYKSLSN